MNREPRAAESIERSRLAARVRDAIRNAPVRRRELVYEPEIDGWPGGSPTPDPACAARTLGGVLDVRDAGQRSIVVDRAYSADSVHGRWTIGAAAREVRHRSSELATLARVWPDRRGFRGSEVSGFSGCPPVFVDIETTGLSGGAGVHAFLVGCASFDGEVLRTRQIFLPGFGDEHRLLGAIAELLDGSDVIVSFNGRTFDVPVMEMRYLFHRRESPFAELRHVDLLPPARRLWRGRDGDRGCSLQALEGAVLGFRRVGDVAGFEIPGRYFHYIRTGDAAVLEVVFEHNRLDLVSLAVLTAAVIRLVGGAEEEAGDARECLEVGRLLERAACPVRAAACFRRAAELAGTPETPLKAEALLALGHRLRRDRQYADAARAFEAALAVPSCPPDLARQALHALAVHHEHRSKDLERARAFTLRGLEHPRARQAMAERLARLDRKLARSTSPSLL